MSVSNVFIEILLTASENQTKITSCFEDCVQGEWTKDERLNDIGHSISMVLTTKRSIFESQQRLRFHIWFIMTHYHKMRQILLQDHRVKRVQIRSFFCSGFSVIRTEYGDLRNKSLYSVQIRKNTNRKKLRIWTLFT